MKTYLTTMSVLVAALFSLPAESAAQNKSVDAISGADVNLTATGSTQLTRNEYGELKKGEYRCISRKCSVTRALCPHTCEERGLEEKNCKTWRSASYPDQCYVKDTRYDTDVMPHAAP